MLGKSQTGGYLNGTVNFQKAQTKTSKKREVQKIMAARGTGMVRMYHLAGRRRRQNFLEYTGTQVQLTQT